MTVNLQPPTPALSIKQQAVRFALSGVGLTLGVSLFYWILAHFFGIAPLIAMTIGYGAGTAIGYLLHSGYSFEGHGSRSGTALRTGRFVIVNLTGYALNQFFVWWLTDRLGGPAWWPIIPVVMVTPILTFFLNRNWVFR